MLGLVFPEAPVPRRIGEFAIVRRLRAEGPFELFLAREEGPMGFAREVTLRSVRRESDDVQHAVELAREARICSRLSHPSIARVLGFFEETDRLVLVLEHLDGTTLATVLADLEARGESMPDAAAAYVASTVASALAAAHALVDDKGAKTPVLHRAVSPGVVHIGRDGTVKLGGFSLAKVLDRTPDSAIGFARGASGALAPEQMRGEPATERTDLWSLGLLCYRLFAGPKASENLLQVVAGRPASLASVRESIPRELSAAIDAALQEDPKKRSITCAELGKWIARVGSVEEGKKTLRELMESVPIEDDGEPTAAGERPSRRKQRAMQRQAPSAKLKVLRPARAPGTDPIADAELIEEPPPASIADPAKPEPPKIAPQVVLKKQEPQRVEIPRIEALPPVPVGGANPPMRRLGTMMGLGGIAPAASEPKAEPAKTEPVKIEVIEPTPAVVAAPVIQTSPRVQTPAPTPPPPAAFAPDPGLVDRPKPALQALISSSHRAHVTPVAATPMPFEDTTVVPRARRIDGKPIVIGVIAVAILIGIIGIISALRPKKVESEEPSVAKVEPKPTAAPKPEKTASKPKPAPSGSLSAAPAPAVTATGKLEPPPGKTLAPESGWLYVHGPTGNTRVMVAGKMRGEPGQVIMTPCGKLYVALAIVDAKEHWRGWAAKGAQLVIPCDGTVGEVTLKPLH